MTTNTRIKANTVNNLLGIQSFALCIGIQFVEVSHAQCQICISKQFNCFRLGEAHKQCVDVFLNRTFLQKTSELMSSLHQALIVQIRADDDAARIQIVIQSLRFTQEFRAEDDVLAVELLTHGCGVAHRNGGLNDHDGVRVIFHDQLDHSFNCRCVKVLGVAIVVRGSSYYNKVRIRVCSLCIQRCGQVQFFLCKILLNIIILNWRFMIVNHIHFRLHNVNSHHLIMLC